MKYFIWFFIVFNTCSLFSMGTQNKKALQKIKKIIIKDKNNRSIAILPFNNLSNNKYYDFIGYTSQKYLFNNLVLLKKIYIETNDIKKPVISSNEKKTNRQIIFNYGTNLTRNVYLFPIKDVNDKFSSYPFSDDIKKFSDFLGADFLVHGNYKIKKNDTFNLDVFVYNRIRNKNFNIGKFVIHKNSLEEDIKIISDKISMFFYKQKHGYLQLVISASNNNIFIDDNFIENNNNIYLLTAGRHKIMVTTDDNVETVKEIRIKQGETNYLYLTNSNNFKEKKLYIKINTAPTNAKVFLNVDYMGTTPVNISNIEPGKYRLKITKTNYNNYFENIKITHTTNLFINLNRYTVNNNYNFYKKLSYITLGAGIGTLLTSYYFYAERDIYWDKYLATRNIDDLNRGNTYSIISGISFMIGTAALGVSLYSFLKTINYDDKNIGFNIYNKRIYIANDFIHRDIKFIMRF